MLERSKLGHAAMRLMFIFAKRFIAGETLEEALSVVERLKKDGFNTTLDILGESVSNLDDAKRYTDEYCNVLNILRERGLDVNMSLKLTQMGLDIGDELCFDNVTRVLVEAGRLQAFIRIDMEGSAYTSKTLDMVKRWHNIYPHVGAVLQSMLKRSFSDMEDLLGQNIPIRICKGAYKEPREIAFQDKRDVDENYIKMMEAMLRSGIYHGIATHDERIIEHAKRFARKNGIDNSRFEFQMLLGIRPALQRRLIGEGYRVRIYVPYGRNWLPYTIRRFRERKENIWFVAKNLFRR